MGWMPEWLEEGVNYVGDVASDVGDAASDAVEYVGDAASDVYDAGAGAVSGAVDTVGEVGADAADYAGEAAESVGDAASDVYGMGANAIGGVGLDDVGRTASYLQYLTNGPLELAHYELRDYLNGRPPSAGDLTKDKGWVQQPDWMADLHQDDSHGGREVKYVNDDGRESIRYKKLDEHGKPTNEDGGEVTDDRYRGTYNYVNPGVWDGDLENKGKVLGVPVGGAAEWAMRGAGHAITDILPWALGGTVRGPG